MIPAAVETTENWPEAAIAIAGIALVGSVIIVALWQLLATWRTRMVGSRETEYRRLAEQFPEAHRKSLRGADAVGVPAREHFWRDDSERKRGHRHGDEPNDEHDLSHPPR